MIDFAEAIDAWVSSDDPDSLTGEPAPEEWEAWVRALFPAYVEYPMAERHVELWEWAWSIEEQSGPEPFVAVFPRGGGKTTTAEMACTALGVRDRRRYAWYVSETQDKADKNVENIAEQLESAEVERHYPLHSRRKVGKYGASRGWRRNRLRTAGGYTVDAVGLDTAARGLKVMDQRPDLIVLDDVDGKHDSLATTAKKIETITTSLLPAGAENCAVLFVQNLILKDGVMTQLAEGRADFLTRRILSGPHPAIVGFAYEWEVHSDGTRTPRITAGRPTWAGQDIESCQRWLELIGPTAFLKEMQHAVRELAEGIVLTEFDRDSCMQHWSDLELRSGIEDGRLLPFAGIDYGLWRFAFLLFVVDRAKRVHVIDELFSQRETLGERAQAIHALLARYGIRDLKVYGDPANPTDSLELNKALERGWMNGGEMVRPRWRTTAAVKERGSRRTGPDRLNEMFASGTLLVRRDIGERHRWWMGKHANSPGTEMVGSRLLWEIENWAFPNPLEGRSQDQNPDDHSADGADMMAALRYAILSALRGPKYSVPPEPRNPNVDTGYEEMAERVKQLHAQHMGA